MADVYSAITSEALETQQRLSLALEVRAGDPKQQAMFRDYLQDMEFSVKSKALDIGCGTGSITRLLADSPRIESVTGIDPCSVFIERAQAKYAEHPAMTFEVGDGKHLPYKDMSFDVIISHTVLAHVPRCEAVLNEAFRVLKPGGWFSAFDGDYATATVAVGDHDPLQTCVNAAMENLVHDRWIVRKLSPLLSNAGFEVKTIKRHDYVRITEPGYLMTLIDRGADTLQEQGCIGPELVAALKEEGRKREEQGRFYGHIAYTSAIGQKPL